MVENKSENTKGNKLNKKKTIIIASIVLLIIVVICGTFAIYFANTPKNRFIANIYTNLVNEMKILPKNKSLNKILSSDNILITSDLNINSNINENILGKYKEIEKIVNALDIDIVNSINNIEKNRRINFNIDFENNEILKLSAINDKNNNYIKLESIVDKYIKLDKSIGTFKTIDEKDTKYIMNVIKKSVYLSLEDDFFTSESIKLTIGEDIINTNKNTLILTDEIVKTVIKNALAEIKQDKNALAIIMKASDKKYNDITEVAQDLDNSIKEVELYNYINDKIYVSIYTKALSSNIIACIVEEKNVNIADNNEDIRLEYINYKNDEYDRILNLYEDNEKSLEIAYKEKEENRASITIKNNEGKLDLLLIKLEDEISINYNLIDIKTEEEYEGNLNIVLNEQESELYNYNMTFTIKSKDINKMSSINLVLTGKVKTDVTVKIEEVKDSTYYKDLKKEDQMKILIGIGSIVEKLDLGKYIASSVIREVF